MQKSFDVGPTPTHCSPGHCRWQAGFAENKSVVASSTLLSARMHSLLLLAVMAISMPACLPAHPPRHSDKSAVSSGGYGGATELAIQHA